MSSSSTSDGSLIEAGTMVRHGSAVDAGSIEAPPVDAYSVVRRVVVVNVHRGNGPRPSTESEATGSTSLGGGRLLLRGGHAISSRTLQAIRAAFERRSSGSNDDEEPAFIEMPPPPPLEALPSSRGFSWGPGARAEASEERDIRWVVRRHLGQHFPQLQAAYDAVDARRNPPIRMASPSRIPRAPRSRSTPRSRSSAATRNRSSAATRSSFRTARSSRNDPPVRRLTRSMAGRAPEPSVPETRAARRRRLNIEALGTLAEGADEPEQPTVRETRAARRRRIEQAAEVRETRAARRRRVEDAAPPVREIFIPSPEARAARPGPIREAIENLSRSAAAAAARRRAERPAASAPQEQHEPRARRGKRKAAEMEATTEEIANCCICMSQPEAAEQSSINGCQHKFCFGCIEQWADRENSCPLCKERFTKISRVLKPQGRGRRRTKSVRHASQRSDYGHVIQGMFPGGHAHLARLIFTEVDRMGGEGPVRLTRVDGGSMERWLQHVRSARMGTTAETALEIDQDE